MLLRLLLVPNRERVGGDLVKGTVERRRELEERLTLWLDGKLVKTVGIGRRLAGRLKRRGIAGLGTDEGLHAHVGQRPSGGAIDDMASQRAAGTGEDVRALDHRQARHPHKRRGHDVVVGAEVGIGAREHPVRAGGEILGRLDVVGLVAEVVRGGEVDGEGLERFRGHELGPITIIEPLPLRLAGAEAGEPIGLHDSDMDLREVFGARPDRRPGGGPGALGEQLERFAIDLGDEIFAELPPGGFRVRRSACGGDGAGLHHRVVVVHLAHDARQPMPDHRRDVVLAAVFEQGFKCLGRSGVAILIAAGGERGGASPLDPVEIGREQRRAIGVSGVSLEKAAEEQHLA